MTVTFTALGNEFVGATGANLNSNAGGPRTPTFDCPTNGATDLVITSHAGDADPYLFEGGGGDGDLVQVVWSPGFEVEQWCRSRIVCGLSPTFDADRAAAPEVLIPTRARRRFRPPAKKKRRRQGGLAPPF